MKFVFKMLILPAVALLLSASTQVRTAKAVIADQSENFNDGNFADDTALTSAGYTFSAGGGLDTAQPSGDPHGGDGSDDGGIFIKADLGVETVSYPLAGTIEDGASYMFGANLFKSNTMSASADVELLAGGSVVASLNSFGRIYGAAGTSLDFTAPATVYYKGTAATAGQQLSFRIRSLDADLVRDLGIDNWALVNRDLASPIATQHETFTDSVPFGYQWSLNDTNGNGGYWDAGANNEALPAFGAFPGDAAQDGAIYANGNNAGTPISRVEHRFDGVIEAGKRYDFSAFIYQSATSFGDTSVDLVADPGGPNEAVVATAMGRAAMSKGTSLVGVSYTGDSSRAGQELAFRFSSERPAGGGSSDVALDGWLLDSLDTNVPLANQFETFSMNGVPAGYDFFSAGQEAGGGFVTNDPATPAKGSNPGDAASDGAIFVNGNLENDPPNTVTHEFLGTIEDGQGYAFSTYLYQSSSSFARSTIELIADLGGPNESVVASLFQSPVNAFNGSETTPDFHLVQLGFTGDASLAGESLSFRISSERGADVSSDVGIDGWALDLVSFLDGDFDFDGDVDGNDFLVWQRNPSVGSLSDWQTNYGMSSPITAAIGSVPEPGSLALVFLGAAISGLVRQRRFVATERS